MFFAANPWWQYTVVPIGPNPPKNYINTMWLHECFQGFSWFSFPVIVSASKFILKIWQTVVNISMTSQFHEFFWFNFWRDFSFWPNCATVSTWSRLFKASKSGWLSEVNPRFSLGLRGIARWNQRQGSLTYLEAVAPWLRLRFPF